MAKLTKYICGGVAVGLFCLLFPMSCRTVSSGYIGVRTTFGRVHAEPYHPGLHFITPFVDGLVQLETRLVSYEVATQAASHDLQVVQTLVSVQHSLTPEAAPASYTAIGDLARFDASVVAPAVLESLKAVTANYTAEELITKREMVKQRSVDAIQEFINQTLHEKGVDGAIRIANISIKDFDFSEGFNHSIEAKVRAQQEALRAENEKQRRITEAEAAAKEIELAAAAQAYQIEQISLQRAAALKREAEALAANPLILQMRAIEKWSGAVPTVNSGANGIVPFLDLSKLPVTNATASK